MRASREGARQVAHLLLHQREPENDDAVAFLGRVNAAVPGTLVPFQAELIDRQVFRPGWLYLGAEAPTCQQLLRLVTDPAFSAHRYFLLDCLVWIGDEQVQAQFQAWRHAPPFWHVTERYGSLEDYPLAAGWELITAGGRHNLYTPRGFELEPGARGVDQQATSKPDGLRRKSPACFQGAFPAEFGLDRRRRQRLRPLDAGS